MIFFKNNRWFPGAMCPKLMPVAEHRYETNGNTMMQSVFAASGPSPVADDSRGIPTVQERHPDLGDANEEVPKHAIVS